MANKEHEILLNLVTNIETNKGGIDKFISNLESQFKKINPELDLNSDEFKQQATAVLSEFDKLKQSVNNLDDIEIALSSDEAQSQLADLSKALDNMMDGLEGVDFEDIFSAFENIDSSKLDDLAKAFEELEKGLNLDGVEKDFKKLVDEMEKGKEETKGLYEAQKKTLDELEKTGQSGTQGYQKLQDEIKQTEELLGKYEDKLEEIKKLGEKNESGGSFLETFLKAEAIATAGEYLSSFAESGESVVDALRIVKAQAGLTDEAVAQLRDTATDLFKAGVGETLSDTIKSLGTANQQLDFLPQEDINKFLKGAGAISKVMGVEIPEVIGKSRTFLQNFSLDGQKGFELIAYASQKTNNSMGDTLDTLDEYSGVIEQTGASATSFVGRLALGVEQGARDTDKLADAMKETAIRINAGDFVTPFQEMKAGANEAEGAIIDSVNALLKQAQAGDITVETALTQSSKLIKEGVDAGQINEALRNKLNVAISGTMAEEIGGELFTNIFSADIDTTAVEKQAKEIGATFTETLGPATKFGELELKFKAFAAKASAFFAPVASAVGGVITTAGQLAPAVAAVNSIDLEKVKSSISSMSKGLANVGDKIPAVKSALTGLGKAGSSLGGIASKIGALGPIAMNPWVIGSAAAVAGLTLFLTQTEAGQSILKETGEFFQDLIAKAEPAISAFKHLGEEIFGYLVQIGKIVWEIFITPFEIWIEIVNTAISTVNDWTGGLLGATDIFGLIGRTVEGVAVAFDNVTDFLAGLLGYIKAAKEGLFGFIREAPALLSALAELGAHYLNPANWFGEDKEGDAIKKKITDAVSRAMQGAVQVLGQSKIDNAIEKTFEIKGDLDKQNQIGKLIEKYEKATDEVEKANLAEKINKQIPGVVSGYKKITNANGEVTTAMQINVEQAKKLNTAQKEAYSDKIAKKQKEFTDGLVRQASSYAENEKKIASLNEQIVNAPSVEKSQELLKERDKLVAKQKEDAENILGLLEKANEKGVITEDSYKSIAKAMGKTTDELKETVEKQKKSQMIAEDQKRSVEDLANAWNSVNDKLSKTIASQTAGLSELQRQINETSDPKQRKELQAQLRKELELARANVKEQHKRERLNEQLLIATGQKIVQSKSLFEIAKEEIASNEKNIQLKQKLREIDNQRKLLDEGREANTYDEIQQSQLQLEAIKAQRDTWVEVLKKKKLIKDVNLETGEIEFTSKLTADEQAEVTDVIAKYNQEVSQQSNDIQKLKLSITADTEELDKQLQELQIQQIQFSIEAGISDATGFDEIDELLSKKLEGQKQTVEKHNQEIIDLEKQKEDELRKLGTEGADTDKIEAIKNQYDTLINAQRRLYLDAQSQSRETYDRIKENVKNNLDYRLNKLQSELDSEEALINSRYDKEIEKIKSVNEIFFQLRSTQGQEDLDKEISYMDTEFNERKKRLEEFKELELLTEDEYNKKIEDIEAESLRRREELKEEFRKKQIVETALQGELNAIAEREKEVATLEAQKKFNENQLIAFQETTKLTEEQYNELYNAQQKYLEAKQLAENNATDIELQKASADAELALEIIKQKLFESGNLGKEQFNLFAGFTEGISETTKSLNEKGSEMNIAIKDVTDTAAGIIPALMSGADQQAEDQFRQFLARRVAFIQKEIEAFVLELILSESVAKYLKSLPFPLNLAALPIATVAITSAVKAITTPILSSILSFAEGGDITGLYNRPTLIQVGDATQSGNTNNREWVASDRNIREIVEMTVAIQTRNMMVGFDRLEKAIYSMNLSTKIRGEDIEVILNRMAVSRANRRF